MGIAVACDGLEIAPTFVQCSSYTYYDTNGSTPLGCRNIPAFDRPLEKLPEFFEAIDADTLIAGVIDPDVVVALESCGMKVVPNMQGDPLAAVREYLSCS